MKQKSAVLTAQHFTFSNLGSKKGDIRHYDGLSEPTGIVTKWWFGFGCVILAGFCSFLFNLSVKRVTKPELSDPLPPLFILLIRQWCIFFTNVPITVYQNNPVIEFGRNNNVIWLFLTLRSLTAMVSVATGIYAVARISLPEFATITAMMPFVTSLISWPLLRQRPKLTDIPLFLACFTGAICIVRPDFIFDNSGGQQPDTLGCVFAFLCVLAQSAMFVTYACLRLVPVASVTTVYSFITGMLSLGAVLIFHFRWPPCSILTRFETIVEGLLGSTFITLSMLASKSLPPAFLALQPISELIFQYLFHFFVKGIVPHIFSFIGACLIVAAFAFLAFRAVVLQRAAKRYENVEMKDLPCWLKVLSL